MVKALSNLTTIVQNMQPAVSNVMIISDEAVASLHLQTVIDALQVEQHVFSFVVPSGEKEVFRKFLCGSYVSS